MKVNVTYSVFKTVEVEIDDRFGSLLDSDMGYKAEIAMARELKETVVRKINDTGIVNVAEVIDADTEECLWEW